MTSREHPFTVAICAVTAAVASATASSQSELDAAANRQRQLVDSIEREVSRGGAYAEELIAPLSELALFYQEADDRALASATIERALWASWGEDISVWNVVREALCRIVVR